MMIIYYIVAIISILTSLVNIPKIKSANTTSTRKVFAFVVDLLHVSIVYIPLMLFAVISYQIWVSSDIMSILRNLILLDVIYLTVILCFFYFNMCILTIIYNDLLNQDVCTPFKGLIIDRIFPPDISAYKLNNIGCSENNKAWIKAQRGFLALVILIHIVVLYKIKFD